MTATCPPANLFEDVMIFLKRSYDPPEKSDGTRFLVDRLWPRGIKKEALKLESWFREVSPSDQLRHWYHQDPERWTEFQRRYFAELDHNPGTWQPLLHAATKGDITLVFSSREPAHNNAVALRMYLTRHLPKRRKSRSSL